MARKLPPIPEIAKLADVSTATVDRVLNHRPGVREKTRLKVEQAVETLLGGESGNSRPAMRAASTRIAFLVNSSKFFSADISALVEEVAKEIGLSPSPSIHTHSFEDPTDLGDRLLEVAAGVEGVVLIGRSSFGVNAAIDRLAAEGKPVVGATTDFPEARRTCYVGMDQKAAGRLAGRLLGEMLRDERGSILMHIGRRSRTEDDREIGFRSFLREHFPEIELREIFNKSATDEEAGALLDGAMDRPTDIPGAIFTTGGGLHGLASRLKLHQATGGTRPFLLGYELLPWSERLLRQGDVDCLIATNAKSVIRDALHSVIDVVAHGKEVSDKIYAPYLIFPENLSCLDWS
ncbi:LacI family DNA-binding transcriptional regulator [Aestuariicoccus sp. MJ-SS9]|uniref:LacI family DNA-binding transcriptional regulator n=1 Tax=Aestuariicoccus sp. MJ-SS9 TaxID=3079855 RepID=UPI00290FFEE2|nr:LacI family DNA-binding transcriptional regulator [Aestuariicoccus sp. MJ-SS9]MDU8913409.1 LacI family DNA-binding transcriptional regulator [Aestuariicoccus sp. MJ-SS9]